MNGLNLSSTTDSTIKRLRWLGIAEAVSWVFLLFIAMPLKYFADQPLAVKYVGWIHGILFILYCVHLLLAKLKFNWTFGKMILGGVYAFFPFGTLFFDRRIISQQ